MLTLEGVVRDDPGDPDVLSGWPAQEHIEVHAA